MMIKVTAPWSATQVDNLNRFQQRTFTHPFTCPGHAGGGSRELVATRRGWICPHCDYTQDWAYEFTCNFDIETEKLMHRMKPVSRED